MGIVPANKLPRLQFYEEHVPPWTANAAAIGLTPAIMTAFAPKVAACRTAYTAQQAAILAAKAATENFNNRLKDLHEDPGGGAEIIRLIKNWAESKEDPNVYVLAQIPAPSEPAPVPPPGTPEQFRVEVLQVGTVKLSWKCRNPVGVAGTIYEVWRYVGTGEGPFSYAGSTGIREFLDETLPSGGSPVTYRITAVRSTVRGVTAVFTVRFGQGGSGATVSDEHVVPAARLAA